MKHIITTTKANKFVVTTMDGKTEIVTLGQRAPDLRTRLQLQAEMLWYDIRHRTHYRRIRNELAREKRNREFEMKIGLVKANA